MTVLTSNVHLPFRFAVGATASRFYRGLRDDKTIFGTRCRVCKKVLVPARSFCAACCKEMDDWVELPDRGTLAGWSKTPTPDGYHAALIALEGADNALVHRLRSCDFARAQMGMKLAALWAAERKGAITDIVCFVPAISGAKP